MSLEIENKIETAWQTLLEANAYISTNSIPVRRFRDCSNDITGTMVIVRVNPVQNEFPNSRLWLSNVEIMAVTYIADDKNQAAVEALYQECLDVATDSTLLQLTSAGGIIFNGKTLLESGEQLFDENGRFQTYTVNVQCHVQNT